LSLARVVSKAARAASITPENSKSKRTIGFGLRAQSLSTIPPFKNCFGVFGNDGSDFEMVMVGRVEGPAIRGLLARLDEPYVTLRFRLTRQQEKAPS
jgi:hypothetical protein